MLFEIVTIKEVKLSIGKICREKREAQKLSRDELAAALNLSRNTIQNIEMGKNANLDNLLKLAYHFDLLNEIHAGLQKIGTKPNGIKIPSLY
ncbi:MAG: helix-turn-helix domain-containing protein [Bacteroidota bacterium]|jgi:transcriptional regulator with XRE-family HTH domain